MNEQAIQVLDEFLNGELGYAELERVWTAAAEVAPNARAELRSHLESLLQSNRLPGEIYAGLMRLVSDDTVQQFRAAPDADSDAVSAGGSDSEKEIDAGDATVARDAGPDADATRIKQPAERDEQLTVDNFQTSPLSFEESTQAKTRSGTERIAPPPEPSSATERIAPSPGASSATERIVPPDAAAETVQNAPPPTPTREVDRNAPTVGKHAPRPAGAEDETQEDGARRTAGADSRPSAADWAHPEKWAASHSGPVGPGSVLAGKYELLSVLGQGGMGVVYRALNRSYQLAEDRKPYVAIKVLSGEFGKHPQAVMALHREARKSQTLAHPNIINVRDFDHDGTTVFMSMELLEGKTLSRTIADQRPRGLAPDVALRIVRGIAAALSYAHEKGIVHSDLKPGNIFVTDEGETKVLDFGIARAVPSSLRSDGDKTVFNVSELGALTPAYASLEMLDGHLPIPADDVFALGLVAYELLVGRHPFDKRPVDKVERVPAKLPPIRGLAGRERRAILRALAFERADRQADAGVFLKEFEGLGRFRRIAYAATAAAAVLAAVAGYQGYRSTLALPDVPFSSLSAPLQQQVLDANVEGQRALGFGALNDAFQYYSAAFGIHRNNPGAIQGLERVADSFLAATATADPRDQRDVMQLLYCQEYLRRYKPVVEACDTVLGASECTVQSLECPLDDAQ